MTVAAPTLVYRTIDPDRDADLVVAHQRDACIATFGDIERFRGASRYLAWLRSKVEEFPDGHLLAFLNDECVGQVELEVQYGLSVGYVSLFYVTPAFRRMGFGRALHERSVRYFQSWEATRVELHVSPRNERALAFYQHVGYRRTYSRTDGLLWQMALELNLGRPARA